MSGTVRWIKLLSGRRRGRGMCLFLAGLLLPAAGFLQAGSAARQAETVPEVNKPPAGDLPAARNFKVEKLADGIYAVIRQEPPGLMVDANSVFIINEEDVVLVDTSGAPSTTREVLAELRKLTVKPVRYLINTHWHDDHIIGDQVVRELYPGVEIIAHESQTAYLTGPGAAARRQFLDAAPKTLAFLQAQLAKNQNVRGGDLSQEERISLISDIRLAGHVLAEAPGTLLTLPDLTVTGQLTLHRGRRCIDIYHPGYGHTAADLVVHLPREGIVIAGDLVVWPIPLVGSEQSRVSGWGTALQRIKALQPSVIIPGHGPVLRDTTCLDQLAKLFNSVWEQTKTAAARGESLEEVRRGVDLTAFRAEMAGESPVRQLLFDFYVAAPAVAAAYREVRAAAGEKDPGGLHHHPRPAP